MLALVTLNKSLLAVQAKLSALRQRSQIQTSSEQEPDAALSDAAVKRISGVIDDPAKLSRRLAELTVEKENSRVGGLTGYDCPICLNRGTVYCINSYGMCAAKVCSCMVKRRALSRIRKSGMAPLLERCTFENYQCPEPWHEIAKQTAMDYAAHPQGWFAACGSVGAGKTHLCTAICSALIESGKDLRYMLWTQQAKQLKQAVNDYKLYSDMIEPLKTVDVLYIDDFFKAGRSADGVLKITEADISLAHEILNHRYNTRAITILSTELTVSELTAIDEAIGSRIYEMCQEGGVLTFTGEKNWRLRK